MREGICIVHEDFVIDKTENGFRVKRIDIPSNPHTHLKNLSACESVIDCVINKRIPRNTGFYYLTSIIRLSDDLVFINKVQELIDTRKSKGKKQSYINPNKK